MTSNRQFMAWPDHAHPGRTWTRRRLLVRVTGLGAGLFGAVLIAGDATRTFAAERAAGAATFGSCCLSVAQGVTAPDELFRRLLSTPFTPGELPPGFMVNPATNRPTGSGMQPITPALLGLVGAAVAELRGPDLTNTIWYYLFASDAEAQDHFEYGELGRSSIAVVSTVMGSTITDTFAPSDVDRPAWCVAARSGPWGWTSCSVLAGNVEVVGYAKARPGAGATRRNDANTIALACAAVAHLDRFA